MTLAIDENDERQSRDHVGHWLNPIRAAEFVPQADVLGAAAAELVKTPPPVAALALMIRLRVGASIASRGIRR